MSDLGITLGIEVFPVLNNTVRRLRAVASSVGVPWWLDFHDSDLLSVDSESSNLTWHFENVLVSKGADPGVDGISQWRP